MRTLFSGLALCIALSSTAVSAQSIIDPNARVVELRESCISQGLTYLDNCFESTSDLTDWMWVNAGTTGRSSEPNSLDPVTVRVGPGTFDRFECVGSSRGWVSVIGSGTGVTYLEPANPLAVDPDVPGWCVGGIDVIGCTGLDFENLTVRGPQRAVNWQGDGDSIWRDVDMIADSQSASGTSACTNEGSLFAVVAWYDRLGTTGSHFFWDSRFVVTRPFVGGGTPYAHAPFFSNGADSWFYGCDFFMDKSLATDKTIYDVAIVLLFGAEARIFGSTIRAAAPGPLSGGAGTHSIRGVQVIFGSVFHSHGNIINVKAVSPDLDVEGIVASGAVIHTPETAFNIREKTGTGDSRRLVDMGSSVVDSPFQWPASTTAPQISSIHGQDTFVKTDAGPGADETRLYIYDDSCTGVDPWRDAGGSGCLP